MIRIINNYFNLCCNCVNFVRFFILSTVTHCCYSIQIMYIVALHEKYELNHIAGIRIILKTKNILFVKFTVFT